ncbi:hypothetical protein WG66_011762 [Moniliophthora roreri]|nr:hypothetical protein WG66_011762 [Moniliophthora roreri]
MVNCALDDENSSGCIRIRSKSDPQELRPSQSMAQAPSQECMLLTTSLVPIRSVETLALIAFSSGFYFLLFSLAGYHLSQPTALKRRRLHLACLISLFLLSTMGAVTRTAQTITRAKYSALILSSCIEETAFDNSVQDVVLGAIYHVTFVLLNCLADSILVGSFITSGGYLWLMPLSKIYRLYVMWGYKRRITVVPIIGMILLLLLGMATTVLSAIGSASPYLGPLKWGLDLYADDIGRGYDCANAIWNLLLTFLLAGRIWWINRKACAIPSTVTQQKYKTIIAVLLESGILYPVALIAHVVAITCWNDPSLIDLAPFAIQMAGIAPTLIIFRTALPAKHGEGYARLPTHDIGDYPL